jgi:hypothetical protein
MNRIRARIAAILFLFLGLALLAHAQQEPGPPRQQEPERNRETAPPRQPDTGPARGQQETRPPRPQPEPSPRRSEKQETPKTPDAQTKANRHSRGSSAGEPQVRPAGKSAHIPNPQFRANFGRQHAFPANRVIVSNTVVPGQTGFVLVGYRFIILDPWPADWLFTDDCFVDYVDEEYFLFDVFHPGVRVALFVVG